MQAQAQQASTEELPAAFRQRARARLEYLRRRKSEWPHSLAVYCEDRLTIRPKTAKPRRLVLNSVQREFDARLDNQKAETGMVRALVLKARQMGISTYVGARFYHRMDMSGGHRTLIMTHRDDATANLSGMVRRFHENDPEAPALRISNARELVFENESGITVATAGTVETGAGRSFTFQLGHLSELPEWGAATTHLNAILPTFPTVEGSEIIIEATARGTSGPFYEMCMAARAGQGIFDLHFYPWFMHDEYALAPPPGWMPSPAMREYGREHNLSMAQMRWAALENAKLAAIDGDDPDEISWRFMQEYPATVDEAFRAGRPGGYIPTSTVAAARRRANPDQPDMPLVFGCDFATGGGGGDAEMPDSRSDNAEGSEDGDANVFIDRQGRRIGGRVYERFRDRSTVSVANRLQALIDEHNPDRVFMDKGGGGAGVYDLLCSRGYIGVLELVDFGASARPVDDRKYRNKRAEMHGAFRDWLADDGDIPDDPLLEAEITAVWVKSEDDRGLTLAPKREVRKVLRVSPDGSDACITTFAAPVRKGRMRFTVGGAER